ncbi:MAG: SPFH domain-containing protein [Planctomycetota bacterium]
MNEPTRPDDRRAQHVAALGLVLQAAAFGTLLGVAYSSKSHAVAAVARVMLAGLPIWFILFLIFKQLRRVGAEELETAELRRTRAEDAADHIFELDDEALLLEQNRLRWMVRWFLPTTTVLVALLLLLGHFIAWGWSLDKAFTPEGLSRTQQPTLMMWFIVGIGFLCFLYARYVIALSRIPNWRMLRAGAACMAGNAFACLGLVIALMAATTADWAEPLFAYLVRVGLIVLGIELTGNFILDFYRPHTPGVVPRPSFDSRLLGLISEPGGIAKSIADAANYQFGFEVSSTWFYQLLQRWMFPIMVVTFVAVLALTGVVIVDADEQVVVERFGRPMAEAVRVLPPGLHVKWPYPIDVVHRAPVKRVRELVIGEATEKDEEDPRKAILWTEAHDYLPELMLLVAAPKVRTEGEPSAPGRSPAAVGPSRGGTASVAVSLLMVSLPIEYRVKDLSKYLYSYDDPVRLMEAVAYQYLSDYGAGVDIDAFMGSGRTTLNDDLKRLIQDRLDALDLGVEIVFAGLRAAHPPSKEGVAAAFQSVVTAETKKAATMDAAEGEARRMLTSVAGTEERARALDEAIRAREKVNAESGADPAGLAEADRQVDELLLGDPAKGIGPPSGETATLIANARTSASELITFAATQARAFGTEVAAYQAAPALYTQRKILEMYAGIGDVRKYLIVGNPSNVIIEYQTAQEGGLDKILSEGLEAEKKKGK